MRHVLRHDAAMKNVLKKLLPLQEPANGKPDPSKAREQGELEEELAELVEGSRGFFDDEDEFEAQVEYAKAVTREWLKKHGGKKKKGKPKSTWKQQSKRKGGGAKRRTGGGGGRAGFTGGFAALGLDDSDSD